MVKIQVLNTIYEINEIIKIILLYKSNNDNKLKTELKTLLDFEFKILI